MCVFYLRGGDGDTEPNTVEAQHREYGKVIVNEPNHPDFLGRWLGAIGHDQQSDLGSYCNYPSSPDAADADHRYQPGPVPVPVVPVYRQR